MPASNPLPTSQVAATLTPPKPQNTTLSQTAPTPTLPTSGTYTLVRVTHASLNPVDYKLTSLPSPLVRLIVGGSPIIPGADFSGRVWSTTHPDLKPGDRVWGCLPQPVHRGTCAQYVLHKGVTNIAKVPEGWSGDRMDELAVVGIAGFTAYQALMDGDLPFARTQSAERGGNVFINGGSGGVGSFMVQMAKRGLGCDNVVATCSGGNVELVKGLGADEVIDYRTQSVTEALKKWSQQGGASGRKFDVIIDCVANDHALYWEAPSYLKEGGRYLQIGGGVSLKETISLMKVMCWPGVLGGGKRPFKFFMLGPVKKEDFEMVGRWMGEGKVRSVIEEDNRFGLGEVGRAFTKLKGGRTRGKMVIEVEREGQ